MLNGPGRATPSCCNPQFRNPQSGVSIMIQPSVDAIVGKMNASQNSISSPCENGTFVGARMSAIAIATGRLTTVTEDQMIKEFPSDWKRPGVENASVQLPRPHSNGGTMAFGAWLKLSTRSSTTGYTRYAASTRRHATIAKLRNPTAAVGRARTRGAVTAAVALTMLPYLSRC